MARKRSTPAAALLPPEIYEECCADLAECRRLGEEVERACKARVNGAEGAQRALTDIRERNQLLIQHYYPGATIPE